jgi:alpha-tubulin suppressor-like RCC1 family protein
VQVSGQSDFVAISAGSSHSLALKADGRVFSWGSNLSGQLGNGPLRTSQVTAVLVSEQSDFVAISGGVAHSLALKKI